MGVYKWRNPQNGVVYVYTSESDVDPTTGKMIQHRHCIGHVDEVTGETVPNTDRRGRPRKNVERSTVSAAQYEHIVRQLDEARAENVTLKQEIAVVRQENIDLKNRQERMIRDIRAVISR